MIRSEGRSYGAFLVMFAVLLPNDACVQILLPPFDPCAGDTACDDELSCNGSERCEDGVCVNGDPPCADPANDTSDVPCFEECRSCALMCASNEDCEDALFCNGLEYCDGCACVPGEDPCHGTAPCREGFDRCVTSELCVSPCGLLAPCTEQPIEDFEDYATMLGAWRESPGCLEEFGRFSHQLAGVCGDGTLFLDDLRVLVSETRYFDSRTGASLAFTTTSDYLDEVCLGVLFWPSYFRCSDAVVGEVICGEGYSPGDPIQLP